MSQHIASKRLATDGRSNRAGAFGKESRDAAADSADTDTATVGVGVIDHSDRHPCPGPYRPALI
jgi:hypothetical protein